MPTWSNARMLPQGLRGGGSVVSIVPPVSAYVYYPSHVQLCVMGKALTVTEFDSDVHRCCTSGVRSHGRNMAGGKRNGPFRVRSL
ncbi:hypothetical protein Kisp02_42580 [Kineosporia sp. NBRC 101731]|nr:hypothetical protein Kisp02_42580 [Kineosporia sp. NBRC 101731]